MYKIDLTDRSNCFYWQTDRKLLVEDYDTYFLKRHEIKSEKIISILKNSIKTLGKIKDIEVIEPDANVLKGNVNIVRKVIINGEKYVVRIHPHGVKNGYFYVESVALYQARLNGLPVPNVLEVHEAENDEDMDFIVTSSMPGMTMEFAIQRDESLEHTLLIQTGQLLAHIHQIKVEKFGFFNNKIAKEQQKLVGLHDSYQDFIFCGLEENIERLLSFETIDRKTAEKFRNIFSENSFTITDQRLVHNDYADWNILADENRISAILDWDECHGGDPIADLACWSTFYDMVRFKVFLKGYTTTAELPNDFDERFHYYRLRYTISKMALRTKRALVDKSTFVLDKIELGKKALQEEIDWFQKNY